MQVKYLLSTQVERLDGLLDTKSVQSRERSPARICSGGGWGVPGGHTQIDTCALSPDGISILGSECSQRIPRTKPQSSPILRSQPDRRSRQVGGIQEAVTS